MYSSLPREFTMILANATPPVNRQTRPWESPDQLLINNCFCYSCKGHHETKPKRRRQPNLIGKSIIHRSIVLVFFGFPSRTSEEFDVSTAESSRLVYISPNIFFLCRSSRRRPRHSRNCNARMPFGFEGCRYLFAFNRLTDSINASY